jgi:hypothetical protein
VQTFGKSGIHPSRRSSFDVVAAAAGLGLEMDPDIRRTYWNTRGRQSDAARYWNTRRRQSDATDIKRCVFHHSNMLIYIYKVVM